MRKVRLKKNCAFTSMPQIYLDFLSTNLSNAGNKEGFRCEDDA